MRSLTACAVSLFVIAGAHSALASTDDLVTSSEHAIVILGAVEDQLKAQKSGIDTGFKKLIEGSERSVNVVKRFEYQTARERVLLGNQAAWDDKRFRSMILHSLAGVSGSLDDLGTAQIAEVKALEAKRKKALKDLTGLVRKLHANQQKLIEYMADDSASKRLGELNVGVISASIVEAKRLRNQLDGKLDEEIDAEKQEKKLQRSVDNLQRVLELLDR